MNTDMKLQKVPVEKLKPAKYNPRKDLKPGDPAYEKIKRSMTTYGYVDPVIWNEVTGNIVGGHQRYKVLVTEGVKEIDCVVVHIENPQDEKALNIALNKAVGEWEPKALADLLSDLQLSEYDLGATGFDAAEVDDLFSKVHDKDVKDDNCDIDADELQPFVQEGDVWALGRHRMVCGDSMLPENLALLMNGSKANLVVTDPPYNVAYESADGKKIQNDSMSDGQFYEFLLAAFRAVVPHLVEGASAYVFHADTEGLNFRKAFKEAGFHISGVCIWVKNTMVLGRSPYQWQHEPVLYGWLPNGKHKANASSDPKIITGVLNRSIQTGKVRKRRYSGRSITIGVHRKEEGAYYAPPVEYGHGGPAPAPAHPFIRPAYDTRSDEAYEIIRDGLRDAIDQL